MCLDVEQVNYYYDCKELLKKWMGEIEGGKVGMAICSWGGGAGRNYQGRE